jgi:site-specific DNA-methyltransferase (adenine-specific)
MSNNIIHGDCLESMKKLDSESIQLVYLDPPFFTQRKHKQRTRSGTKEYSFSDTWDSMNDYIDFLKLRVTEINRILTKSGSIVFHCDDSASHHIRVMLDEVFGTKQFRSEIIWSYKRWSNAKKGLLDGHQTIYWYSKSNDYKFNRIFVDYSPTTNVDQIMQLRERDERNISVYKKDKSGKTVVSGEKKGVPMSDVWQIPYLNPKAKERVGYPTQKPVELLMRIVSLFSDEGDTVLDPFCGSGTTIMAANEKKRNAIGMDCSQDAIDLTMQRLENPVITRSRLLSKGYDDYKNADDKILEILSGIDILPVQRNSMIDCFYRLGYQDNPLPIRIQKEGEDIEGLMAKFEIAAKKKDAKLAILIINQPLESITEKPNKPVVLVESLTSRIQSLLDD